MAADRGLRHWLDSRLPRWQAQLALVRRLRRRGDGDPADLRAALDAYRSVARDLSLARRLMPGSEVTRGLESLYLSLHDALHTRPVSVRGLLADLYLREVPRLFRAMRRDLALVALLLVASALTGWLLVHSFPDLAPLFASRGMIRDLQQGHLWTRDMLNVMPPSLLSLNIMSNNMVVTLTSFVLGALYGLGTLYIVGTNGLMLGTALALTARYGLAGQLLGFVLAHGIVELGMIILAGAAGVRVGRALVHPGQLARSEAFRHAAEDGLKLAAVWLPALAGSGLIEGFVSPNPGYPLAARAVLGMSWAVIVWTALTGDLWRLPGRYTARLRRSRA
ncbi:MAG TPA: stage II sporulation protein M [Gammaproteobacteria bacterium]|nr:stage II sporulation protein M [Gammaproteobacteria bacterium]